MRKCQGVSRCKKGKSTCSPRSEMCKWSCQPSICIVVVRVVGESEAAV